MKKIVLLLSAIVLMIGIFAPMSLDAQEANKVYISFFYGDGCPHCAKEEIFLEKYLSILDKNRNEPRDIYDLWYLISNKCLDYQYLAADIKQKGEYKGLKFFDIIKRKIAR